MRITRVSVEKYVDDKDWQPIQIDGIPEGFSFLKLNERTIGGIYDHGQLIVFTPNANFEDNNAVSMVPIVYAQNEDIPLQLEVEMEIAKGKLLDHYNKNRNGK